jgi:hypothetical protein
MKYEHTKIEEQKTHTNKQTKEKNKEDFFKFKRLVKVVIDALTTTRHAYKQEGKYKLA